MYDRLKERKQGISAAVIYRMIENEELEQKILLQKEFYTDDHCYWPKKEDGQAKQEQAVRNQNQWNKIARQTKMEQEMRGGETTDGEDLFLAQAAAEKSRRSYKDFLQRFSVLREEIGVDPEEFDLNYYTYGLKLYGNMPLMEPLESREVKKIREFVIAIDTSYSTSGTLVEQFLKETFSILTQKNSFFAQSKIRVIQCDNQIRSDVELKSERDIAALMQEFTFAGGGSTDFRLVFSYINDLIERGELKNLGGLLYFTDGRGAYPKIRPEYQTAFLFLEDYDDAAVPPWAIRLKLEPEEFEGQNAKG
jgi:predicted metal-dependent peptidase